MGLCLCYRQTQKDVLKTKTSKCTIHCFQLFIDPHVDSFFDWVFSELNCQQYELKSDQAKPPEVKKHIVATGTERDIVEMLWMCGDHPRGTVRLRKWLEPACSREGTTRSQVIYTNVHCSGKYIHHNKHNSSPFHLARIMLEVFKPIFVIHEDIERKSQRAMYELKSNGVTLQSLWWCTYVPWQCKSKINLRLLIKFAKFCCTFDKECWLTCFRELNHYFFDDYVPSMNLIKRNLLVGCNCLLS